MFGVSCKTEQGHRVEAWQVFVGKFITLQFNVVYLVTEAFKLWTGNGFMCNVVLFIGTDIILIWAPLFYLLCSSEVKSGITQPLTPPLTSTIIMSFYSGLLPSEPWQWLHESHSNSLFLSLCIHGNPMIFHIVVLSCWTIHFIDFDGWLIVLLLLFCCLFVCLILCCPTINNSIFIMTRMIKEATSFCPHNWRRIQLRNVLATALFTSRPYFLS